MLFADLVGVQPVLDIQRGSAAGQQAEAEPAPLQTGLHRRAEQQEREPEPGAPQAAADAVQHTSLHWLDRAGLTGLQEGGVVLHCSLLQQYLRPAQVGPDWLYLLALLLTPSSQCHLLLH